MGLKQWEEDKRSPAPSDQDISERNIEEWVNNRRLHPFSEHHFDRVRAELHPDLHAGWMECVRRQREIDAGRRFTEEDNEFRLHNLDQRVPVPRDRGLLSLWVLAELIRSHPTVNPATVNLTTIDPTTVNPPTVNPTTVHQTTVNPTISRESANHPELNHSRRRRSRAARAELAVNSLRHAAIGRPAEDPIMDILGSITSLLAESHFLISQRVSDLIDEDLQQGWDMLSEPE